MAVGDSVDPAGWFAEQIGACEPDLLRQMVKTMAEALMSAEADAICGAWPEAASSTKMWLTHRPYSASGSDARGDSTTGHRPSASTMVRVPNLQAYYATMQGHCLSRLGNGAIRNP